MPQAGPLSLLLLHFQLEQMSPISRAQILSFHTHWPISTMTPAQHPLCRWELDGVQWNTRVTCSAAGSSVGSGMTDGPLHDSSYIRHIQTEMMELTSIIWMPHSQYKCSCYIIIFNTLRSHISVCLLLFSNGLIEFVSTMLKFHFFFLQQFVYQVN